MAQAFLNWIVFNKNIFLRQSRGKVKSDGATSNNIYRMSYHTKFWKVFGIIFIRTWIRLSCPQLSILEATLTVFPQMSYLQERESESEHVISRNRGTLLKR